MSEDLYRVRLKVLRTNIVCDFNRNDSFDNLNLKDSRFD
jgi:hypothetical protein